MVGVGIELGWLMFLYKELCICLGISFLKLLVIDGKIVMMEEVLFFDSDDEFEILCNFFDYEVEIGLLWFNL